MPSRDWQIHVWKSTATSLSTAGVDFTITNAQLSQVPVITGSRLRPLDGRTEARPWSIAVNDGSSFITSQIGDAGGRLDLLNRFVQARLSIDGSTYRPVGGGRLIDAVNTDNIAEWLLSVQDEWLAGSNALLFTTNTTLLFPPKPYRGYKGAAEGRAAQTVVTRINAAYTGAGARRLWYVNMKGNGGVLNDEVVSFIKGDLVPSGNGVAVAISTRGNFKHLRFRANGTDYKVVGFDTIKRVPYHPNPNNLLFNEDELNAHQREGGRLNFWIAASSTAFGGAGSATLQYDQFSALHAMTAPASIATPLHIWPGWSSANPYGSVHPMQVLKDVLDGVYSSSSEKMPYYSTEAFTGTADVRRLPTNGVAFRVTQPQRLKEWVTENLLTPHGMAAFGDYRGKVTFKSIQAPDPQLGYSTSNLYSFTSTNLRQPHPDWRTTRREQVTQLALEYERLSVVGDGKQFGSGNQEVTDRFGQTYSPAGFTLGGDGISAKFDQQIFNHDRMDRYGVFTQRYRFHGYGIVGDYNTFAPFPEWLTSLQYYGGDFAKKTFARFGDGPVTGTLYALPGASTIEPGQFARLTLGSYPNFALNARGGTRLVQILSKDITPEGYVYEYLDSGGAVAPLTSPTVSLSTSTANPQHALRVTVSAGVPTSGGVTLYAAESLTTSPPGSTSAAWHPIFASTMSGPFGQVTATGTYIVGGLKSNTRQFVKGQAWAMNRARSNYSTPVTRVTASITAPSVLTMTSVKAKTCGLTFTIGNSDYPTDVHVDTSTAAPSTANRLFRLPAGTNRSFIANLTPSQAYRSWVRHADPFGGFSGSDSTTFTMTSTATTSNTRKAPPLGGLYVVFGST